MVLSIHIIRAIFFYFYIVFILRFLGKREIGQLGVFDLIILLIVADLAVLSIENTDEPIWYFIIVIGLLALIQKMISFLSLKFGKLRSSLDGKISVIIFDGKINYSEMKKQLYSIDDLLSQLRENKVSDIKDVSLAVLETNGTLSVFKNDEKFIPLPIIINGRIIKENLIFYKVSEDDIKKLAGKKLNTIMVGYYKPNEIIISSIK